ncbi:hypothetical protein M426DRAFT_202726 [Hypoxylon sp. CI-4A]|nr:hypothetical protein M426DRAFT_202726 [Hypoxylon sp. CI-4A]
MHAPFRVMHDGVIPLLLTRLSSGFLDTSSLPRTGETCLGSRPMIFGSGSVAGRLVSCFPDLARADREASQEWLKIYHILPMTSRCQRNARCPWNAAASETDPWLWLPHLVGSRIRGADKGYDMYDIHMALLRYGCCHTCLTAETYR